MTLIGASITTKVTELENVGAAWFPKRGTRELTHAGPDGEPRFTLQTLLVDSVVLNPELPDSLFQMRFPPDMAVLGRE